ncbi:Myb-like DNA-binding domain containing protein [Trichomonas vaginalis G3]|uniref:Myb-like DNA-binding domain containing protein n=1 Tax=Trichomonas vaginalis (strain ATCC PRA-98 / G3) TaxID=412133 RepID=A2DZJ6_TRIV3|nr:RNA polymerase II transcription regulator recruiting protein [Trichomonas vaginalis G3]EAY14200.1 Myb-like DNA-binding domain containing protein [Trichomonas vaginalis G3]KAI5539195.1 RNA polymerase II transcription regulator recruiting protein [Trichomonas vaginalis G3]|eukprot:XP_001326423.1 Myb-like DNA-binding domain containing protein [Trichomonas vaginalis G3]
MSDKNMRAYVPKIKFTLEEDERLTEIIERIGTKSWRLISLEMKNRTPRQCRERWINYISPQLRNDPWTEEEDKLLDEKCLEFGSRWHKISEFFNNRSGNAIRNRFKLRQRHELRQSHKLKKQKQKKSTTPAPQPIKNENYVEAKVEVAAPACPIDQNENKLFDQLFFKFPNDPFELFQFDQASAEDWMESTFQV